MARRRRFHVKHPKRLAVISAAIGIGQGFAAWEMSGHNPAGALSLFTSFYTGFSPLEAAAGGARAGFIPERLLIGWVPWATFGLASRVARSIGARPRSPIPGLSFS